MSDIFRPLLMAKGEPVVITTWGLGSEWDMREVICALSKSKVKLLVGYNKRSHDLQMLRQLLGSYKNLGWDVHMLPGFHVKAWLVGKRAYVGSCNFAPSTIVNQMWRVSYHQVYTLFDLYWQQSAALSHSTVLELIPQAKVRHDE